MSNLTIPHPRALILGALFMLAACDDGPSSGDPLTQAEAEALIVATATLTTGDSEPLHSSVDSIVYACPAGGRVKQVGSLTEREEGSVSRLTVDAVITPADCMVKMDEATFTLDGDPSIRFVMHVDVRDQNITTLELTGIIGGSLKYKVENRTGVCPINTQFSAVPDLSTGDLTLDGELTGTVCGHTVKLDIMDVLPPLPID